MPEVANAIPAHVDELTTLEHTSPYSEKKKCACQRTKLRAKTFREREHHGENP